MTDWQEGLPARKERTSEGFRGRDCQATELAGRGGRVCEGTGRRPRRNMYIHRDPGPQAHSQGALEAQNCGACAWLAAATRRSRGCLSIPAQPSSAAAPALMSTNYADNANATLAWRPPILRPAYLASAPPAPFVHRLQLFPSVSNRLHWLAGGDGFVASSVLDSSKLLLSALDPHSGL
jgi:hypothetical protein